MYHASQDLSRLEDGTENPPLDEAAAVATVEMLLEAKYGLGGLPVVVVSVRTGEATTVIGDLGCHDRAHPGDLGCVQSGGVNAVGDVGDPAAAVADQVMVDRGHVRVVPPGPSVEVQLPHLTEVGQLLERAVHRGPADLGQKDHGLLVDLVGGEVDVLALEHLGHDPALGGQSVAALAQPLEEGGRIGRQSHRSYHNRVPGQSEV